MIYSQHIEFEPTDGYASVTRDGEPIGHVTYELVTFMTAKGRPESRWVWVAVDLAHTMMTDPELNGSPNFETRHDAIQWLADNGVPAEFKGAAR